MEPTFPPEIALVIANHLYGDKAAGTLSSLARTSKQYCEIISPVLYRRISLTPETVSQVLYGLEDGWTGRKWQLLLRSNRILHIDSAFPDDIIERFERMGDKGIKVFGAEIMVIGRSLTVVNDIQLISCLTVPLKGRFPGPKGSKAPFVLPRRLCSPKVICVKFIETTIGYWLLSPAKVDEAACGWSARVNYHQNFLEGLYEYPWEARDLGVDHRPARTFFWVEDETPYLSTRHAETMTHYYHALSRSRKKKLPVQTFVVQHAENGCRGDCAGRAFEHFISNDPVNGKSETPVCHPSSHLLLHSPPIQPSDMHDPIPPELALIVATHLRRGKALKTLASLASVSRGYSDVITPVLYRRITLTNENLIPLMAGIDDEDMVVTRLAGRKGANLWFLCEILEIIGPLNAMSEFRVKVWSSIHSTLFGAHTLVLITSPGQQPYIPPKRLCSPRKVCVTSLGPASSGMRMDAAADAAEAWSAKLNIHNPIAKLCEKPRNSLEIRRFWQHCVDQDYGALGCTSSSGRFGRYPCCQYDMVGRAFQLVTRLAKIMHDPIPIDVALVIARNLQRSNSLKTLASLVAVSYNYFEALTPKLYRRLTLTDKNFDLVTAGFDEEANSLSRVRGKKRGILRDECKILQVDGPMAPRSRMKVERWKAKYGVVFGAPTLVLGKYIAHLPRRDS
ncbi:hypothetical protein P7C73_g4681, partial [Tremellales sp. Uapishka_1]